MRATLDRGVLFGCLGHFEAKGQRVINTLLRLLYPTCTSRHTCAQAQCLNEANKQSHTHARTRTRTIDVTNG